MKPRNRTVRESVDELRPNRISRSGKLFVSACVLFHLILTVHFALTEVYPRVCGKRSQDFYPPISTRESRIIDGVPVAIKAYPWQVNNTHAHSILRILENMVFVFIQVSLKVKEGKESKQHCGGAIISNRLILTAAHCIDLLREDEYFITVGEEDTSVNRIDEEQIFEVEKQMIHPKYCKSND